MAAGRGVAVPAPARVRRRSTPIRTIAGAVQWFALRATPAEVEFASIPTAPRAVRRVRLSAPIRSPASPRVASPRVVPSSRMECHALSTREPEGLPSARESAAAASASVLVSTPRTAVAAVASAAPISPASRAYAKSASPAIRQYPRRRAGPMPACPASASASSAWRAPCPARGWRAANRAPKGCAAPAPDRATRGSRARVVEAAAWTPLPTRTTVAPAVTCATPGTVVPTAPRRPWAATARRWAAAQSATRVRAVFALRTTVWAERRATSA